MSDTLIEQDSLYLDNQYEVVNVSKVKQLSPFRYPGGKTWLVPEFTKWLLSLPFKPKYLVEPFAGGGIISLSAAYYGFVNKCIMVEKDEEVAAVWKTILYGNWEWLVEKILSFNLTHETAKEVLESPAFTCEEIAFKTILKNRVNHGGILANGSGMLKYGENGKGILSRWYPQTLVNRIKTIVSLREKLEFYEGDAFDYLPNYTDYEDVVFFVDPPYTASKKKAGKRLYRYSEIDHDNLFKILKEVKGKFMLTYDYDENIINFVNQYEFKYKKVPMKGTHNSLRLELIISNTSI